MPTANFGPDPIERIYHEIMELPEGSRYTAIAFTLEPEGILFEDRWRGEFWLRNRNGSWLVRYSYAFGEALILDLYEALIQQVESKFILSDEQFSAIGELRKVIKQTYPFA